MFNDVTPDPNSAAFLDRLRLIVTRYLDEGESVESAANRVAALALEWASQSNQRESAASTDRQVPTTGMAIGLEHLRPNKSEEDARRFTLLMEAVSPRMRDFGHGAA